MSAERVAGKANSLPKFQPRTTEGIWKKVTNHNLGAFNFIFPQTILL